MPLLDHATPISARASLSLIMADIQQLYRLPDDPWLEHALAEPTSALEHEMVLTVPPQSAYPVLVIFHRLDCGCDAVPLEVVLHG